MFFGNIDASTLSESELIEKLQGTWECVNEPSHFRIQIKDNNIKANNDAVQKINLEKFDNSWSFYLNINIPGSIAERLIVERVIIMTFRRNLFGLQNLDFDMAWMEVSPATAKSHKDLVIYDCRCYQFKLLH